MEFDKVTSLGLWRWAGGFLRASPHRRLDFLDGCCQALLMMSRLACSAPFFDADFSKAGSGSVLELILRASAGQLPSAHWMATSA